MLIPAAVDLYYGHRDWQVFAFSAMFTGGLGLAVAMATQGRPPQFSTRFGFLVVNLLWLTTCIVGAVPLYASSLDVSLAGAFFESVSGITTTGGSVLTGLDTMAPGILMWRALLNWMGGLGVIAFGVFVLPMLNIGGVSYFRIESSSTDDRPFARFSTYTYAMIAIYAAFTGLCAFLYAAGGMTGFNAVTHAMSTLATGGFANHDNSFGYYADNPLILWTGTVFMAIGALPFTILILFIARGRLDALGDPQIKVFLAYLAGFTLAVAIYMRVQFDVPFFDALTHSAFNFTSVITTTGFASDNYNAWGPFAVTCIFVATFLGGCSGSTTGGIKAYRFLILFEMLYNGLRRLIYPNTVLSVRYGDRVVDDTQQRAVVLFVAAFFMLWLILSILVSATGVDIVTAITGVLSSLTNVGPGLGDIIGPVGNYAPLPDSAKWLLALAMLLGRLEILAVLVIFTPVFWGR
jgi:trk system potassium uptake protein TrkH